MQPFYRTDHSAGFPQVLALHQSSAAKLLPNWLWHLLKGVGFALWRYFARTSSTAQPSKIEMISASRAEATAKSSE